MLFSPTSPKYELAVLLQRKTNIMPTTHPDVPNATIQGLANQELVCSSHFWNGLPSPVHYC